jgi:hypothetical protein
MGHLLQEPARRISDLDLWQQAAIYAVLGLALLVAVLVAAGLVGEAAHYAVRCCSENC